MKSPVWSAICTLLFFYYFLLFKDAIFDVYYETSLQPYSFDEEIKVTLCSPLSIFNSKCLKGRRLVAKLDLFNCTYLQDHPLECMSNDFRNLTAAAIIRKIRKCDHDLIFGKNRHLVMYKKKSKTGNDIEINQEPIKFYVADRNTTYLNNGDYCMTIVFGSYSEDLKNNETLRNESHFQFSVEGIKSSLNIYLNQEKTNYTYFNFHQLFFKGIDYDYRNVSRKISNNATSRTVNQNVTTKNEISDQKLDLCIPRQNITIYSFLTHTRIRKLGFPYEDSCLDSYGTINNKTIHNMEQCIVECFKSYVHYFKFLYTDMDELKLTNDTMISLAKDQINCEQCENSDCTSDFFNSYKYKVTYAIGSKEEEEQITKPLKDGECNSKEVNERPLNNKIKFQISELIEIIEAKPTTPPMVTVTYIFGLLNTFIGLSMIDLNRKLICSFLKLKNWSSSVYRNKSATGYSNNKKSNNCSMNYAINKRFKNESNQYKKSNQLTKNNRLKPGGSNLIPVSPYIQSRKRPKLLLNPYCYNIHLKQKIRRDLSTTKEFKKLIPISRTIEDNKLTNLNRLVCFWLLIILSVYFFNQTLTEIERDNNRIAYNDFYRPNNYIGSLSVSFCFDFEDLLIKKRINEDDKVVEKKILPNSFPRSKIKNATYLDQFYSNYTLKEIDDKTMSLETIVDSVFIGMREYKFKNESESFNLKSYIDRFKLLVFYFQDSKCIRFFLNRTDYQFTTQLENSFVWFHFKPDIKMYFIEQYDQLPNRESIPFNGHINFNLDSTKYPKEECFDFENDEFKSEADYTSSCVQESYIEKYQSITVNCPVVLDDSNRDLKFDNKSIADKKEQNITCVAEFGPPCHKVEYLKYSNFDFHTKIVTIQLSNRIKQTRYEKKIKAINFINFMLSVSAMIYDLNLKTLTNSLILFVLLAYSKIDDLLIDREIIRSNEQRRTKIKYISIVLNFLRSSFLFIGIFIHLYNVSYFYFYSNELVASNYIDRLDFLKVPNLTICVGNQFNTFNKRWTVDIQNRTGIELNDVFPSLVDTIEYIEIKNEIFVKTRLDNSDVGKLELERNYADLLYIKSFYYEESKCTSFHLSVVYDADLFNLYNVVYPFRFKMRKLNTSRFHYTVFIGDKNEYSFQTPFTVHENHENHYFYGEIDITFDTELVILMYLQHLIKWRSTLTFTSTIEYLDKILTSFLERTGQITTKIPIDERYFNYTINNQEFMNFYETEYRKDEDKEFLKSIGHFFRGVSMRFETNETTTVQLNPRFTKQNVKYGNKLTFSEFVLYVGTIISFWLNTCYFDLANYLKHIFGNCFSKRTFFNF